MIKVLNAIHKERRVTIRRYKQPLTFLTRRQKHKPNSTCELLSRLSLSERFSVLYVSSSSVTWLKSRPSKYACVIISSLAWIRPYTGCTTRQLINKSWIFTAAQVIKATTACARSTRNRLNGVNTQPSHNGHRQQKDFVNRWVLSHWRPAGRSMSGKARLVGDGCQLDPMHCQTVGDSRTKRSAEFMPH